MKKIILSALILLSVVSCKKKEDTETQLPEPTPIAIVLGKDCYGFEGNNNSIALRVTDTYNGVKGYLKYHLHEKDSNKGAFQGVLNGDTLVATYTFQSEGVESKREVAFLIKGNQLLEGYGEMTPDGTKFKDIETIKFSDAMPLTKTDCKGTADCPPDFGFVFSELKKECLNVSKITSVLNPMKEGMSTTGEPAYVLFSDDNAKAELFLPNETKSIILDKTSEGNWGTSDYKLTAWKGFVLHHKGKLVFAGE